ncbi:squalene synthetase-like protein [Marasmius crinis-equi]|uniref:Protein SQS1 n=1 Tax=Marasmius crinis-equi TaxID=585013 RepID=A0ABR3FDD9_9AGAR
MPKNKRYNKTNVSDDYDLGLYIHGGRGGFLNGPPRGSPRGRPGRGRGGGGGGGGGGRGFPRGGRGGYIPSSETDFVLQMWPQTQVLVTTHHEAEEEEEATILLHIHRTEAALDQGTTHRMVEEGAEEEVVVGSMKIVEVVVAVADVVDWEAAGKGKIAISMHPVHQRFLFMEEEDILKPVVEDVGDEEESHVPTADRVAQVFGHGFVPRDVNESPEENGVEGEELEEIDFTDLARFQESVNISATTNTKPIAMEVEETFTGTYARPKSPPDVATTEREEGPSDATIPTPAEDVIMDAKVSVAPTSETHSSTSRSTELSSSLTVGEEGSSIVVSTHTMDSGVTEPDGPPTPLHREDIDVSAPAPMETLHAVEASVVAEAVDNSSTSLAEVSEVCSNVASMDLVDSEPASESPAFFIDTTPAPTHIGHLSTATSGEALGLPEEDVIVYVAPHPRSGRATPAPAHDHDTAQVAPTAPITSVLTGLPIGEIPSIPKVPGSSVNVESVSFSFAASSSAQPQTETPKSKPPLFTFMQKRSTPARMKMRQRSAWSKNKRGKSSSFALRGAGLSEARMWGGDDSDVDWGDDSGEEDDLEEEMEEVRAEKDGTLRVVSVSKSKSKQVDNTAEGMDVDPELDMDAGAMNSFVRGIDRGFVTMDDLEDERRMRKEDKDGSGGGVGSSGESDDGVEVEGEDDLDEDAVIELEEQIMIGEDDEDEDEDEGDWDDEEEENDISPKSSFQARLDRLRKQAQGRNTDDKGKQKATDQDFYEDLEDSDDDIHVDQRRFRTWAEEDDDYIAEIEELLAENEDILTGRDRKARNALFRAVRDGDFDDDESFMPRARKRKDKDKDLPPGLAELWEKDRAKKAERRRERDLEKLMQAADPLAKKKGGKKGRKAAARLANLDPTISVLPNRIIDMTTLVQQIRRFLDDIGGPRQMALPPTNKETRKMVHELAQAFNLKSVSKGKGNDRYTTLTKTTRSVSGIVNEKKVGKVVRWGRARGVEFASKEDWTDDRKKGARMPKHREGDEVGKAAPKINETNVGFRLLAAMGWEEGDRIGLSGGLKDPLTAVIKHSKLGLGANR